MDFKGFQKEDFDVFTIEDFDERMTEIKSKISSKLDAVGDLMAPALSTLTGENMYKHVARHARRSVNPPDNTWVAFADDKRGYKKHPHFQVGLWQTHLFIWFAVINEAQNKPAIAENLDKHLKKINKDIPKGYVWSKDHTQPDTVPQAEADLEEMFERLKKIKKAEVLCGRIIGRDDPVLRNAEQLTAEIEKTFETVLPLYEWAKKA